MDYFVRRRAAVVLCSISTRAAPYACLMLVMFHNSWDMEISQCGCFVKCILYLVGMWMEMNVVIFRVVYLAFSGVWRDANVVVLCCISCI